VDLNINTSRDRQAAQPIGPLKVGPSVRSVESLGPPASEHRPSAANKIAGIILSLLMIGGGLALGGLAIRGLIESGGQLPLQAQHGHSWFSVGLMLLLALVLVGLGGFFLVFVRNLSSLKIVLCPEGFYCIQRGETTVFAWDEISLVEEHVLHEHLPIVKGAAKALMPTVASRSYTVRRCDGRVFSFDGNTLPRVETLAVPLSAAMRKRNVPWQVTEGTS